MKLSKMFWYCAGGITYETVGNNVNYAFLEEDDTLYIFFQGSSSTTDWIRNFLFKKKPYEDMQIPYKVHRGFLSAWKEVQPIIIDKILEREETTDKIDYTTFDGEGNYKKDSINNIPKYKWKHVVVIGYSHGGALAAFCHECVWFYREDLREEGLEGYGFEAPRIYGSFKVREELKERWATFTVVRTNNDIVTHCPPRLFGFCHVGSILEIKGDNNLVEKNLPPCVKSHYPQVVYWALIDYEK